MKNELEFPSNYVERYLQMKKRGINLKTKKTMKPDNRFELWLPFMLIGYGLALVEYEEHFRGFSLIGVMLILFFLGWLNNKK